MSLDTDALIDRRRLKRRLTIWRLIAIVVVVGAAVLLAPSTGFDARGDHVARIHIDGVIMDDADRLALITEAGESSNVKAILLSINSPGGGTTASEALYETVRKAAKNKPVVAVLGTVAASGGYVAAISADHIVARGNTLTGSIGVLFQWTQLEGLLGKLGVKMQDVKSSPLKAEPDGFGPTPKAAIKVLQDLIDSSYDWFIGLVMERRGFDDATARKLGDGRIYTGFQAKELGLVDEIGGEEVALAWLASEHDIDAEISVEDWEVIRETPFFAQAASAMIEASFGSFWDAGQKTLQLKGLTLDGLVSVWHPNG